MAEMNPIIETLIRLIQAKQEDEALKQRKDEALARNQFEMEQLARQGNLDRATIAHQLATQRLAEAKTRSEFEDKFREQAGTGLRELQGEDVLPEGVSRYLKGNLVPGQVPYDLSAEDLVQPQGEFKPFSTQIAMGPLGPQVIEGVVPREKIRKQALEDFKQQIGLKTLEAGLTAQAQETAKEPGRKAARTAAAELQIQKDKEAAERLKSQLAGQERIAGIRAAATIEAAKIRGRNQKVADDDTLINTATAVALGEVKLPAGNNGSAVINTLKSLDFSVPNQANVQKVPYMGTMMNVVDRISKDIIPRLATSQIGAKLTGIGSAIWPTDLKNAFDAIELDATTAAREAGEKGNFSNSDIGRALKALSDKGITQEQALQRLQILKDKVYHKLWNESLGGLSDKQKLIILQKYNVDPFALPAKYLQTKSKSGEIMPTYFKDANGTILTYNKKTNLYE